MNETKKRMVFIVMRKNAHHHPSSQWISSIELTWIKLSNFLLLNNHYAIGYKNIIDITFEGTNEPLFLLENTRPPVTHQ